MNLKKCKVLITGGALRIGRSICLALAGRVTAIAVHYNESENDAQSLVAELKSKGTESIALQGDLSDPSSRARVMDQAWLALEGLNVLINNAGVFHRKNLQTCTEQDFLDEVTVNAFAPMSLSELFMGKLRAEGEKYNNTPGVIINLLDRRITEVDTASLSYSISKKMLSAYTVASAARCAPLARVNGVAPGAVLAREKNDSRGMGKEHAGYIPLGIQCGPDDVASAVVFLMESDAVTGQIIYVDGGQHLAGEQGAPD